MPYVIAANVKSHGVFSLYTPELPADLLETEAGQRVRGMIERGVLFARNEIGNDFYTSIAHTDMVPTGHVFMLVDASNTVVSSVADNGVDGIGAPHRTRIWPVADEHTQLIEVTGVPMGQIENEYVWWVWDGAVTFTSPQPVIPSVSAAQAKIILVREGLFDQVKEAVSLNPEAQIWFENAGSWRRDNPYVAHFAGVLGLSTERVDELFLLAAEVMA